MKLILSVFVIASLGLNACSKSKGAVAPAPVQPVGNTDAEKQKVEAAKQQQQRQQQQQQQQQPVQQGQTGEKAALVKAAPVKGKILKPVKGTALPSAQHPIPGQQPPAQGQVPTQRGV